MTAQLRYLFRALNGINGMEQLMELQWGIVNRKHLLIKMLIKNLRIKQENFI